MIGHQWGVGFRYPFLIKYLVFLTFIFGAFLNPSPAVAQFRFDTWTTDNGLPQSSIVSILQTRDGFLWFTTNGGLVRYDGLQFQVFNPGNTKGLRTSRFMQLYEDKEGTLWIATERQGITRYKDGQFTTYSVEQGVPPCLFHIREDKNDNLLLRCMANEITQAKWTGAGFTPYTGPPGEPTKKILWTTSENGFWYLEDSHLRKFEDGRILQDYKINLTILRAFEDNEGYLWFAANENTSLYRIKDGQITSYSESDGLFNLRYIYAYEDRQDRIWFGSEAGLMMFKDGRFTRYTTADGLARGAVSRIYQDREGTIWVGTTAGLSRITERVATSYAATDGLAADNVYPIYEDRAGKIWIGSWLGLTTYQNGAFENAGKNLGLAEARITSFYEDREGNFWIGTLSNGVYRIKDGQITVYSSKDLPGSQVRAIEEDREGNIWFGVEGALVKFKDGTFTKYTDPFSDKLVIQAIHKDRQGRLWIGTEAGLYIYKDGTFARLTEKDGIAGVSVRTIKEDIDGTLWFGMYDMGLYRFKDGKFTHFTTNDGLFDNGAFQILEDAHDNFWISCNLGIYRVKRTELNDFAEGRTNKITSVPYNKRDGMLNAECNGGVQPAGIRASDGRLWFPTQAGVVVINPDSVPVDTAPPPVVIEAVSLDMQSSDIYKPVEIQPNQTYLEIHYSGLSFTNPELVKFKYRLEGLDMDWIDAGTRRTAYYTHLPPGKYHFTVLAANRDGIWNVQGASLEITVLPPFWQTWWFLTLSFLMLAAIAFFFYRWRIGILKRTHEAKEAFSQQLIESREVFSQQLIESQEAERKRIAGGLHDNLGQHLIIIKNWASLGLKLTGEDAPIRQPLGEISETALKALSEVHEIIHNLRPYQIETVGLNNAVKYMIEQVAASSGINFETHFDNLDNLFSPEDEVTFYRMIQECVSNIVKHSKAENAGVSINRQDTDIIIKISDDGCGFTPGITQTKSNNGSGGFGLTGLAERVRMLSGTLNIQSMPGEGTTILININ